MTAYALPFSSALAGVAGLLFFFVFFVAMAMWVYRPGAKAKYQNDAHIPFKE
ncbi:MAG: CcoQ/FixQ family Cbb3-type cytochrome c oxidase assembly chaperone [Alphaproteobacteria bacterium]